MQKYETTASGSHTPRSRSVLWIVTLVVAGFGLPALAVKPGNKGIQSTASVSISLEVRPSVKARYINRPISASNSSSGPVLESSVVFDDSENFLCLDVWDTRTLTFFVVTPGTNGSVSTPVANWSFADNPNSNHVDSVRCPIPVSLNMSQIDPAANGHVTLLVSPE